LKVVVAAEGALDGPPAIRIAMEAGRIDPRRAEKVIEIYSSLSLMRANFLL
jgi:hypothetical protein